MNDGSIYVCTCIRCGAVLERAEREFQCPKCGVWIRLIWRWDGKEVKAK